jgi:hypothetical protein
MTSTPGARLRVLLAVALAAAIVAGCTAGVAASPSGDPGASAAASPGTEPRGSDKPKADKPDRGRGWRAGVAGPITITAVSGSNVSLETADGWTRTIAVTAETEITKGGEPIALGDLEVGDEVRLRQQRLDDGTYQVTAIAVVVPTVKGEVTAVTDTTMTIERRGETRTVTLTSSTAYHLGRADGTKADVTVGRDVVATGEVSGTTFTAIAVVIEPDAVAGEVTSKTADSLAISRRDGSTVTVKVGAETRYRVRGIESATLADVAVGARIVATGRANPDGTFDASAIAAKKPKVRPNASPAPSPTS